MPRSVKGPGMMEARDCRSFISFKEYKGCSALTNCRPRFGKAKSGCKSNPFILSALNSFKPLAISTSLPLTHRCRWIGWRYKPNLPGSFWVVHQNTRQAAAETYRMHPDCIARLRLHQQTVSAGGEHFFYLVAADKLPNFISEYQGALLCFLDYGLFSPKQGNCFNIHNTCPIICRDHGFTIHFCPVPQYSRSNCSKHKH